MTDQPAGEALLDLTHAERDGIVTVADALTVGFAAIRDCFRNHQDVSGAVVYIESKRAIAFLTEVLNSAAERTLFGTDQEALDLDLPGALDTDLPDVVDHDTGETSDES